MKYLPKIKSLKDGINELLIKGENYFAIKKGNKIRLFSSVCPHMGGKVKKYAEGFKCQLLGWEFNDLGECTNSPKERYGLYCAGCNKSVAEDINTAANAHGLSKQNTTRLIEEWESSINISLTS